MQAEEEPPVPGGAPTYEGPAEVAELPEDVRLEWDEAIAHLDGGRFHKASVGLFLLLRHSLPTVVAAEARVLLGRCLETINQRSMAGHFYLDAVRLGGHSDTPYQEALRLWADLSIRIGDPSAILARLRALRRERDPQDSEALAYLRARSDLERGKRDLAVPALLELGSTETLLGRQASYLLAVALLEDGDAEGARRLLEPLVGGSPKGLSGQLDDLESQRAARLQELASLGLARLSYARRDFEVARQWYTRVGPASVYAPRAAYELAWVDWMEDRLMAGIPRLAELRLEVQRQPSGGALVPEAPLLAVLYYLRAGQFDLADGTLRAFLENLHQLRLPLQELARIFPDSSSAMLQAELLLGLRPELPDPAADPSAEGADAVDPDVVTAAKQAREVLLPLLDDYSRDQVLASALRRLALVRRDRNGLERQLAWWKTSELGLWLTAEQSREEKRALREIGVRLSSLLLQSRLFLSGLNLDGLALQREITLHRLAQAQGQPEALPYRGEPLPPLEFEPQSAP